MTSLLYNKLCESGYSLYIYFSMDHTEIIIEYLVYDMMTIISAIKGSMGLLLGYSVLSMLLSTLKVISNKLNSGKSYICQKTPCIMHSCGFMLSRPSFAMSLFCLLSPNVWNMLINRGTI